MKVILTKDVADLGSKGEVVEVAPGYARNYLVPRSLAVKATAGSLRQAEAMRRTREEAERRLLDEAEALGQSLVGTRVVIAARASDEGKLFGSIGSSDVSEAIIYLVILQDVRSNLGSSKLGLGGAEKSRIVNESDRYTEVPVTWSTPRR